MKEKLLQIEGLSVGYGGKTVLQDVDLTVCYRDFLGIIGPNGGGKTTLVKAILGLSGRQSGRIRFFHGGEECGKIAMGYLPQYSSIDRKFPISVEEVIGSGLSGQKSVARLGETSGGAAKWRAVAAGPFRARPCR